MYQYQNALKPPLYEAMMMHDYVENYLLRPKNKILLFSSLSGGKKTSSFIYLNVFFVMGATRFSMQDKTMFARPHLS